MKRLARQLLTTAHVLQSREAARVNSPARKGGEHCQKHPIERRRRDTSIPQITLVVFNPVFVEKGNELIFKGFLSVVRLLILYVTEDLMFGGLTDAKGPYHFCHAKPRLFRNVSCTQRDEFDFTDLTSFAIEMVDGSEL